MDAQWCTHGNGYGFGFGVTWMRLELIEIEGWQQAANGKPPSRKKVMIPLNDCGQYRRMCMEQFLVGNCLTGYHL